MVGAMIASGTTGAPFEVSPAPGSTSGIEILTVEQGLAGVACTASNSQSNFDTATSWEESTGLVRTQNPPGATETVSGSTWAGSSPIRPRSDIYSKYSASAGIVDEERRAIVSYTTPAGSFNTVYVVGYVGVGAHLAINNNLGTDQSPDPVPETAFEFFYAGFQTAALSALTGTPSSRHDVTDYESVTVASAVIPSQNISHFQGASSTSGVLGPNPAKIEFMMRWPSGVPTQIAFGVRNLASWTEAAYPCPHLPPGTFLDRTLVSRYPNNITSDGFYGDSSATYLGGGTYIAVNLMTFRYCVS
jgi:hypothetical protein